MRLKQVSYVPIRDDSHATFSSNEHAFVEESMVRFGLRLDGRSLTQLRPARIQLTRSASDGATGCTVQWGSNLSVHCQCAGQVVPPTADRPNEGFVQIYVDLSPMASTGFKFGNSVSNVGGGGGSSSRSGGPLDDSQKLQANRLLRHLENLLTHCLDSEALVIIPGQWVWQLQVRVAVWDCVGNGNLLDATVLCVLAALRHYRQPSTTMTSNRGGSGASQSQDEPSYTMAASPQTISLDQKEGSPLPLHHTPLSITFAWLHKDRHSSSQYVSPMLLDPEDDSTALENVVLFVDPTWQEQAVAAGNELTLSLNVHGEVCGMVSSGAGITQPLLRQCHAQAMALLPQLIQSLETTLQEANLQALQEGLQRMQQQHKLKQHESAIQTDHMEQDDAIDRVLQAAEESYRKQALEYNLGHQAVQVRDGDSHKKKTPSRLLQSLLQAVSQQKPPEPEHNKVQVVPPVEDAEPKGTLPQEPPSPKVRAPPDATGITVLKLTKPENSDTVVVDESTVPKRPPPPPVTDGVLDSDDEEETTQLDSEFGTMDETKKKRSANDNDDEYNAILEENQEQLDAEEEEAFWEEQRNTNLSSTSDDKTEESWGPDKIKGGRIPKAPAPTPDGKPNPRHKARQMANRRNQQKKSMNKRSGGGDA